MGAVFNWAASIVICTEINRSSSVSIRLTASDGLLLGYRRCWRYCGQDADLDISNVRFRKFRNHTYDPKLSLVKYCCLHKAELRLFQKRSQFTKRLGLMASSINVASVSNTLPRWDNGHWPYEIHYRFDRILKVMAHYSK